MTVQLNHPVSITVYFEENGEPTTGITDMMVTLINRSTGLILAGPTVASEGNPGYYSYTLSASYTTAPMRLQAIFQSTAAQVYEEAFDTVDDVPDWAQTKGQLRVDLARRRDGDEGVFVLDASAATTTGATVADLNYGGHDEYAGMWVRFMLGLNAGAERRIDVYDHETASITWSPALTAAPAPGENIEVYRTRPSLLDRAIDRAISTVATDYLRPFEERIITTDGATSEWLLPSDAVYINQVDLYHSTSGESYGQLPQHWWDVRAGRKLRVIGGMSEVDSPFRWKETRLAPLRSGYRIGVRGLAGPTVALHNDSTVAIPPDYIIAAAAYDLMKARPDMAPLLPFFKREVEEERRRISEHTGKRRVI